MQYVYDLSACNRGLFKSYFCCFIFAIRFILQILSLYIFEKEFPYEQI